MVAPGRLVWRAFEYLSRIRDTCTARVRRNKKSHPEVAFCETKTYVDLVHRALTAGATTLVFLQVALAQTDGLRRDFDQFVVVDKLNRVFQRHLDRRHETH